MEVSMDYIKELQKIYDSEINFTINSFWDGGIVFKLGDGIGGYYETKGFHSPMYDNHSFRYGVEWLINQVMKYYPDSEYSQKRIKIINKIREGFVDTDKFTDEFLNKMIAGYKKKERENRYK